MYLVFGIEQRAMVPEVGDFFRVGGFFGTCVEVDYCEEGATTCANVVMKSKQIPLCACCEHCCQETSDDVACCNCCSMDDDEHGQCFFSPYSFDKWTELLKARGLFKPFSKL